MTEPCFCSEQTYARFQGDAPRAHPKLLVEAHDASYPDTWQLRCSVCGTRWQVDLIPSGGLYGDFEWERLDP